MKVLPIAALALAAGLALAGCSSSSDSTAASASPTMAASEAAAAPAAAGDIIDIASTTKGFSTLAAAVTAAGLVDTLKGTGPFTVFAPTDAAFAALPAGILDALLLPENRDALIKILKYHVVAGAVMSGDITDGQVATLEGQKVTLSTDNGNYYVEAGTVVQADVVGSNGVIHAIDVVLLPPDVDVAALTAG